MITTVLWYILIGIIIGVIARLLVPGRNPLGVLLTLLVGVAGAILGGAVSDALGAGDIVAFIFALLIAALGVTALTAARRGRRDTRDRAGRPR